MKRVLWLLIAILAGPRSIGFPLSPPPKLEELSWLESWLPHLEPLASNPARDRRLRGNLARHLRAHAPWASTRPLAASQKKPSAWAEEPSLPFRLSGEQKKILLEEARVRQRLFERAQRFAQAQRWPPLRLRVIPTPVTLFLPRGATPHRLAVWLDLGCGPSLDGLARLAPWLAAEAGKVRAESHFLFPNRDETALLLHAAALCVAEQGQLDRFLHRAAPRYGVWMQAADPVARLSRQLALDAERLARCLEQDDWHARFDRELRLASELGIFSTPTLLLNGIPVGSRAPTGDLLQGEESRLHRSLLGLFRSEDAPLPN